MRFPRVLPVVKNVAREEVRRALATAVRVGVQKFREVRAERKARAR